MKSILLFLLAFLATTAFGAGVPQHDHRSLTTLLTKPTVPATTVVTADVPSLTTVIARAEAVRPPLPHGSAEGGALDPEPIFDLKNVVPPRGPDRINILVVNNAGVHLDLYADDSTKIDLAPAATATVTRNRGWAGRVAIHGDGKAFRGDESLIEASYHIQGTVANGDYEIFDLNVSFVDGFTFPVKCFCTDGGNTLSGCDINLFGTGRTCPDKQNNACRNPKRSSDSTTEVPHPFFEPCKGQGYTYPHDHEANSNGECQSGTARCVVYRSTP